MAISIDTVYQTVLALANKEQRGYITPQEFNLFANQAQGEIFEQYFYDVNQWSRIHGNSTEYSDMLSLLEEKVNIFNTTQYSSWVSTNMPVGANGMSIPAEIYRLGMVRVTHADIAGKMVEVEMLSNKNFQAARMSPLTAPTKQRPIGTATSLSLQVLTSESAYAYPYNGYDFEINYIRKPAKVEWGYFVINDKALYDSSANKTQDFELHASEESELVYRILAYAGVTLQKPQLTQIAAGLEGAKVQQEKK